MATTGPQIFNIYRWLPKTVAQYSVLNNYNYVTIDFVHGSSLERKKKKTKHFAAPPGVYNPLQFFLSILIQFQSIFQAGL